ncbi:MAG: aldehyde dehydrogenase family protein [Planctomycetota bacterium]
MDRRGVPAAGCHGPRRARRARRARACSSATPGTRPRPWPTRGRLAGLGPRAGHGPRSPLLDLGDRLLARAAELEDQAARFARLTAAAARADLRLALERLRWFAGCGDKLPALLGGVDTLHGVIVGATVPAPVGVVIVVPPERPPLLGLVACVAPLLVAGNAVVVVVPPALLPAASTLAQTLATCELGGGVANLLCVEPAALVPLLAAGPACDALLLAGGDPRGRLLLREAAAEHGVRVHEARAGFDEPATTLLAAFTRPRAFRQPSDLS